MDFSVPSAPYFVEPLIPTLQMGKWVRTEFSKEEPNQ